MEMEPVIATDAPCPTCGGPGGERLSVAGMEVVAKCDKCERVHAEKWEAEEARRVALERVRLWEAVCPSLFRGFDPAYPTMAPEFAAAYNDFDPANRQGLGLIGGRGTGKTHVALWCLKKCVACGLVAATVKHSEFAKLAATLAKGWGGSPEESRDYGLAKEQIARLRSVDALLIDDLCKGRATPTSDELLFSLLDGRVDNCRMTLWTANSGAAWMLKRFGSEYGLPIIRRLAARTTTVNVVTAEN